MIRTISIGADSALQAAPQGEAGNQYVETLQQELIQSKLEIQRLMKEVEQAHSERNDALFRLTQEFKALNDQHRRKLVRYKDEYTHNIELVKGKLQEIKRDQGTQEK